MVVVVVVVRVRMIVSPIHGLTSSSIATAICVGPVGCSIQLHAPVFPNIPNGVI